MKQSYAPTRHRLSAALLAAMIVPFAGQALAQDAQSTSEDEETKTAESSKQQATNLEQVTVTGSRIARDTFNSVSPIQVINREETTVAGFNSTTGVLQSNTVTAGSAQINNAYGGYVVNGGGGVNTLSLRGLGATRTLLLLNGRRVAPSGSRGAVGATDLNVLPNIMVDRIEILKDGASSIYGSDAVAGVVNIVTRRNVDGPVIEFQQNVTQDGGGNETRASVMNGLTRDNWWVSGSLEAYHRSEMTIGDRDWASECPRPLWGRDPATGEYGTQDYVDPITGKPKCWGLDAGGVTINTIGTPTRPGVPAAGTIGTSFNRWRPNAAVTGGTFPGYEGVSLNSRDTFEPRMLEESLISPTHNFTGFLQGGVDIGALGDAELYFELLGSRRESRQTGYRQLSMDYPRGSLLLPPEFRNLATLNPPADGSTNGQIVAVRAFVGFGTYDSEQNVDFYRAIGGIRGNLTSEWNYDFNLQYARSNAKYMIESFLTDRIARSYDVVATGSGFACRNPADGCVAAPALTPSVIGGNLPQAWVNYIFQPTWGNTLYTDTTANLNVDGPLFDLPHGTVSGAFGLEYRRSEIDDSPAPDSVANNLYGLTASQPTRGKDAVMEAFAEIEIPVLSGMKGAEELTFNVSGRYTEYDSYGSDTTYKIGMLYTPVQWVSLRGSYGTSFRAPALFEQFLGATTGFLSASTDPCEDWGDLPATSLVRTNCSSEGLPANFQQTSSVQVATKGGAETGLAAETSTALTAGIVFQPEFPEWFGDLSFAADYYDIQVDNGVTRLSGGQVINLCYGSLASDFQARNGWCNLVTRGANNGLSVTTGYVNISTSKVRGWDFTTRYVRDIGPGTFRATALVTNFMEQSGRTFPDDPIVNWTGTLNSPQYTGNLDLAYTFRNWMVRYGLEWVDGMDSYDYYADGDPDLRQQYVDFYKLYTDDFFLHALSARYAADNWSVTGGVRNLTNETPPVISNGVINTVGNAPLYSGFDYFGRSFFVNFTKEF